MKPLSELSWIVFSVLLCTIAISISVPITPICSPTRSKVIPPSTVIITSTRKDLFPNFSLFNVSTFKSLLTHDMKAAIAGGIAGGFTNAVLFPLDTFKTMRQTDSTITSMKTAFHRFQERGFSKIYSGFLSSVIGSTSSSAIYFGTYEWSKSMIFRHFHDVLSRPVAHMLAAASGNIMSSIIFVPKDAIKQQMQYLTTNSLQHGKITTLSLIQLIFQTKGLKGFYPSYRATLLRNIPSAIIKFTLYEEFKYLFIPSPSLSLSNSTQATVIHNHMNQFKSLLYLAAGGIASSLSSGLTTPFDVVKSRLATGMIPPGTPILQAMKTIAEKEGIKSLYKGVQARMLWSALFGAIGFYSFETCRLYLEVDNNDSDMGINNERVSDHPVKRER